jgi:hypothetical protein
MIYPKQHFKNFSLITIIPRKVTLNAQHEGTNLENRTISYTNQLSVSYKRFADSIAYTD